MGKPRLIFINRVYWPSLAATAQLLTDLAEGLAIRGWTVHVIATGAGTSPHNGVTIHRTGEGDSHGGMLSRALNYRRFIRRAHRVTAALVQSGDIVVVMTDPPMLGAAMTQAVAGKGAQVIHWIQDIYPEIASAHIGAGMNLLLFPSRRKRDAAWQSAFSCVALGETMAGKIAAHGVPVSRIATIPNWAPRELQTIASESQLTEQRANWGLGDKFVVAYSGNLGRVHEFKAILVAAEILRDRTDIIFLFIGTGAGLATVRSTMVVKHLKNVRILPPAPRDRIAASLTAADIQLVTLKPAFAPLVYPSKLAGVLAAGRPVIFVGPPDGEIARLVEHPESGACVSPGDGAGLASTILQWQANPSLRRRLGENARGTYEKKFSFDSAINAWEKILGETLTPDGLG